MGCCQEGPFLLTHSFSQKDTGILCVVAQEVTGPRMGIGSSYLVVGVPDLSFSWVWILTSWTQNWEWNCQYSIIFENCDSVCDPPFWATHSFGVQGGLDLPFLWDFIALGPCKGCYALAWERVQVPLMKVHRFNSLLPFLFSFCLLMAPKDRESTSQVIEFAQRPLIPEGAWHLAGRNVS